MMPMSPIGQQPGDTGQPGHMRMVQTNPPDIVHQRQETVRHPSGIMSSYHHQEMDQRFPDHDATPDLVRATEPTYMNENVNDQDQEQPTYANGKISKDDGIQVKTTWDESRPQPDWSNRPPASV